MSIDTEMWVAADAPLGAIVQRVAGGWVQTDAVEWVYEGQGWQLLVYGPEEADPSEAAPDLAEAVGTRSFRIELTIEPAGISTSVGLLTATIQAIATELDGVGLHPQTGQLITR